MELRAGYKPTEVGAIPIDWEVCQLGELATTVASGRSKATATYGNYLVHGSTGVIGFTDIPEYKGDAILVARVGANAGKLNYVFGEYGVTDNTIIVKLGSDSYLPYYWRQLESKNLNRLVFGSGQPLITGTQLKELRVCAPPLPEQRAIATALSDVDVLLASQDKLIAKKRDIKQAAMQQLLTGKQRLPGFSGAWEVKTIEELEKAGIVKLSRGKVISKKDIENMPGENPIYSSSVKNDGLFGCYGGYMFDEEMITWSVDGGGHFFHRVKHKFSVTNVCGFMRVDTSKLGYRFLAAQLQLLHSKLKFDYQDKAHPSIIRKAYSVLIPSMTEQAAIATVLSDMDAELTALEQQRDKTRTLKQGMMQELLTGRIRLA